MLDDCTSFLYIFVSLFKINTPGIFAQLRVNISWHICSMESVWLDSGGNLIWKSHRQLCGSHGTWQEFTTPITPKKISFVGWSLHIRIESATAAYIEAVSLFPGHTPPAPATASLRTGERFWLNIMLSKVPISVNPLGSRMRLCTACQCRRSCFSSLHKGSTRSCTGQTRRK